MKKINHEVRHTHQLGLNDLIPRPCHTARLKKKKQIVEVAEKEREAYDKRSY